MSRRKTPLPVGDGHYCYTENCAIHDGEKNSFVKENMQRLLEEKPQTVDKVFVQDVLFSQETLQPYLDDRLVHKAYNKETGYSSYKYTRTTQYKSEWDEVTENCRGLILDDKTGEIIARPFSKFFNYSEQKLPPELMKGPIEVTEKLDGSLGIGYVTRDGEFKIASSGSLDSAIAKHATKLYKEKYDGKWTPHPNYTYLWEVISPESRIVVDYGKEDDLYLIGAINKRTGKSVPLSKIKTWKWKRAEVFSNMQNLSQVVNSENRPNHEGYVVHFTETDARVKIKHEDYVKLHRVATGVNERRIWEIVALEKPDTLEQWKTQLPEEFLPYVNETIKTQREQFNNILQQANTIALEAKQYNENQKKMWDYVVSKTDDKTIRSAAIQLAKKNEISPKTRENIWKLLKPAHSPSLWSSALTGKKDNKSEES